MNRLESYRDKTRVTSWNDLLGKSLTRIDSTELGNPVFLELDKEYAILSVSNGHIQITIDGIICDELPQQDTIQPVNESIFYGDKIESIIIPTTWSAVHRPFFAILNFCELDISLLLRPVVNMYEIRIDSEIEEIVGLQ